MRMAHPDKSIVAQTQKKSSGLKNKNEIVGSILKCGKKFGIIGATNREERGGSPQRL